MSVAARRTRLIDCNPRWISGRYNTSSTADYTNGVHFDCPEGHEGCSHMIPFTPALDGTPAASFYPSGTQWQQTGDTFETLTLTPSILMRPTVTTEGRVIDPCAFHGFVTNGEITFCGDSR